MGEHKETHLLVFDILAAHFVAAPAQKLDDAIAGGKLKLADFNPGVRLPPPNRPGFWGQPQLQVMVRIDDTHYFKGWNWMRGQLA